ncbi:GntR family transcriptional regulator, partial [Thioclava sp. BHET1]
MYGVTRGKKYADQVHAAILSSIVEGRYRPGDMLNELPISAEFGVSRTPVREALHRLVAEGLVERGPRRALLVRRVPIQALHELF